MVINEKVLVGMSDFPKWVKWRGKIHKIAKIGLHYKYNEGRVLYHIFSVATETLAMKLKFDTETLGWKLEEVDSDCQIK